MCLEDKQHQGKEKAAEQPSGEQELEQYMESMPSLSDDNVPLAFWNCSLPSSVSCFQWTRVSKGFLST